MGMGTLDSYVADLEEALLSNTKDHYARKSQEWIETDSTPDYMIKVRVHRYRRCCGGGCDGRLLFVRLVLCFRLTITRSLPCCLARLCSRKDIRWLVLGHRYWRKKSQGQGSMFSFSYTVQVLRG